MSYPVYTLYFKWQKLQESSWNVPRWILFTCNLNPSLVLYCLAQESIKHFNFGRLGRWSFKCFFKYEFDLIILLQWGHFLVFLSILLIVSILLGKKIINYSKPTFCTTRSLNSTKFHILLIQIEWKEDDWCYKGWYTRNLFLTN